MSAFLPAVGSTSVFVRAGSRVSSVTTMWTSVYQHRVQPGGASTHPAGTDVSALQGCEVRTETFKVSSILWFKFSEEESSLLQCMCVCVLRQV